MHRLFGILQLLMAGLLGTMALSMVFGLVSIATGPDGVRGNAAFLGQVVVLVFLLLWSRVLFVKGRERVRSEAKSPDGAE
jgi:hypothetical protein